MGTVLSIIIPSYNAERYLETCINSFLVAKAPHNYELIIVNDGSTDRTRDIAQKYAKEYPEIIKLINKKNAGHGSAINEGVKVAKGCYFKVVDADDWLINFKEYLEFLSANECDVVVSGYQTVDMLTGKKRDISSVCSHNNATISLQNMSSLYPVIGNCFCFHGLTYKTEKYRAHGITLSEYVFYEDQEYACLPFTYAETVAILPFFVYQHLVGNAEQSIASKNQVKRLADMEVVIKAILKHKNTHELTLYQDEYFLHILERAVTFYLAAALVKNPNKKEGLKRVLRMMEVLSTLCPKLVAKVHKKYKLLLFLNKIRFPYAFFENMLHTKVYMFAKNIYNRSSNAI